MYFNFLISKFISTFLLRQEIFGQFILRSRLFDSTEIRLKAEELIKCIPNVVSRIKRKQTKIITAYAQSDLSCTISVLLKKL